MHPLPAFWVDMGMIYLLFFCVLKSCTIQVTIDQQCGYCLTIFLKGIYKSGPLHDLPNCQHHHKLITLFDTPPAFGKGMSLHAESIADICELGSAAKHKM